MLVRVRCIAKRYSTSSLLGATIREANNAPCKGPRRVTLSYLLSQIAVVTNTRLTLRVNRWLPLRARRARCYLLAKGPQALCRS